MPIYTFGCAGGHLFDRSQPMSAGAPDCPVCGAPTCRRPCAVGLSGRADAGRPLAMMPQTWRGTHNASREYVTALRREADRRVALEQRHPDLRGETRRVVAHEGPYAHVPLYEGDSPVTTRAHRVPPVAGANTIGGQK